MNRYRLDLMSMYFFHQYNAGGIDNRDYKLIQELIDGAYVLLNTIEYKEKTQSQTEAECVDLHKENDRLKLALKSISELPIGAIYFRIIALQALEGDSNE